LQSLVTESEFRRTHKNLEAKFLKVDFADCPVEASLGLLGKKWTFLIIRDISLYGRDRFNGLLKSLPGIPPKVLATRLKQLEQEGFIKKCVEKEVPPRIVRWSLTEKGIDVIPVGMMLSAFGSKWKADTVFDDGRPRKLHEIYNDEAMKFLMKYF
jgi:DNA-binding HxlR family transcriptional regulator